MTAAHGKLVTLRTILRYRTIDDSQQGRHMIFGNIDADFTDQDSLARLVTIEEMEDKHPPTIMMSLTSMMLSESDNVFMRDSFRFWIKFGKKQTWNEIINLALNGRVFRHVIDVSADSRTRRFFKSAPFG